MRTLVSTKKRRLSPSFIRLFPANASGSHARNRLHFLPFLERFPVIGARQPHLFFEHPTDQFGDANVLIGSAAARPSRSLFCDCNGDVLQHEISVTRSPCVRVIGAAGLGAVSELSV